MKQTFSSEQVQEILKKAARLQSQSSDHSSDQGLSLEELQQIGRESGIDPSYIEEASKQLLSSPVLKRSTTTDTHNKTERLLPVPVDQIDWESMVDALNHQYGKRFGEVDHNPTKREWTHNARSGIETRVSLTKQGDQSMLRLSERVGLGSPVTEGVGYGTSLAILIGSIAIAASDGGLSLLEGVGLFSVLISTCSILVYTLDTVWRKHKAKNLSILANQLTQNLFGNDQQRTKEWIDSDWEYDEPVSTQSTNNKIKVKN